MSLVVAAAWLIGCDGGTEPVVGCVETDKIIVYADNDKDGFGALETGKLVCPPVDSLGQPTGELPRGFSSNDDDCDDLRSDVNPSQIELCDGEDNDCDLESDEGLRETVFFVDGDGDGWGNPDLDESIQECQAPPGYVDNNGDCDDSNATISPDGVEVCDGGIDNDCDQRPDDADLDLDLTSAPAWYFDSDGDSYGNPEVVVLQCLTPGESWVSNADDCLDVNPQISPSQLEVCNHIDDDCDDHIDDSDPDVDPVSQTSWFADLDNDGFGDPGSATLACFQPWFTSANDTDCDDAEPLLGLPAPWVRDGDLDGFGAGVPSAPDCDPPSADYVLLAYGYDCDDENPFTNPLGVEKCDGEDNDCDDDIDDEDDSLDLTTARTFYRDRDGDTYGALLPTAVLCEQPPGFSDNPFDCDDLEPAINLDALEVCDGVDNDCDVWIDDEDPSVDLSTGGTYYADFDEDGFGNASFSSEACEAPDLYVSNDLDCDDTDDQSLAELPWLPDLDGDGVGRGTPTAPSCTQPQPGYVIAAFGIDCDDSDETRFPGNPEICNNGNDEDCSGDDLPCFAPRMQSPRWTSAVDH